MLIDRILKQKIITIDDRRKLLIEQLSQSECFGIDNIAEYFFEDNKQEVWDLEKDFPNVAPLFPNMFFEYSLPNNINSEGEISKFEHWEVKRIGTLIHSNLVDNDTDIKWICSATQLLEMNNKQIIDPMISLHWMVTKKGQLKLHKDGLKIAAYRKLTLEQQHDITSTSSTALFVPLLAISFMHCKNVVVETINPSPKLNKARMKRGNPSLVVYKILGINPVREIMKTEGDSGNNGLKKALHICRGHFKDYTDKGLFGKYKGLYWWDNHIRGNQSNGVVLKDYEVKIK